LFCKYTFTPEVNACISSIHTCNLLEIGTGFIVQLVGRTESTHCPDGFSESQVVICSECTDCENDFPILHAHAVKAPDFKHLTWITVEIASDGPTITGSYKQRWKQNNIKSH